MAGKGGHAKQKEIKLPISRIRTIMKSSPEVENIGLQSLYLVAKSTEMFITYLAKEAYKINTNPMELDYKSLAEVVQTNEPLAFLREIMPKKITFGQYKDVMRKKGIVIKSAEDVQHKRESAQQEDMGEEEEDIEEVEGEEDEVDEGVVEDIQITLKKAHIGKNR